MLKLAVDLERSIADCLAAAKSFHDDAVAWEREKCAKIAHNAGHYSHRYVDDDPPKDVMIHNYACWKIRDAILARKGD